MQRDQFNTPLSPEQEQRFQDWLRLSGREGDLEDYDLRGAWLADARAASNGHLPDTWKKPNHPTFSTESMYARGRHPGRWFQEGDRWVFEPGADNMPLPQLQEYFRQNEPDAELRPLNTPANIAETMGPQ